ncbi:MAG: hypothetical protein Q7S60_05620 [bacterium]|nr:hypothetical protein [bacterium]
MAIILGFLVFQKLSLKRAFTLSLLGLSTLILGITLLSGLMGNIVITYREEAAYFALPLAKKLQFFSDWYGFSLPLFLPLGLWAIFKRRNDTNLHLIAIIGILSLALALAPFSYFLKFYVVGRYFIHIILVAGIVLLLRGLTKFTYILATIWIGLAFLVVFYLNQLSYKETLYFEGVYSHISVKEIRAALWLKNRYAHENVMLLSDPGTQYVFEAISGLNSQGGSYMNFDSRAVLASIPGIENTTEVRSKLKTIEDNRSKKDESSKKIIILSGRYFAWQSFPEDWKNSFYYNVWSPRKINPDNLIYINSLTQDPSFKVVYQNDEFVIIELL